ncbi:hypothetical protein [Streptomyces sp. NPDC005407]|uniref:hypothetical protein n=1 Tax=Streptomyces sp. NPDC005407 TaxID=3155340 RepID=UPI0033AB74B6
MSQSDHDVAAGVRYVMQWICGLIALGALAMVGLVVLVAAPSDLVFIFKRGSLLPEILVFAVAAVIWLGLTLHRAVSRSSGQAELDDWGGNGTNYPVEDLPGTGGQPGHRPG